MRALLQLPEFASPIACENIIRKAESLGFDIAAVHGQAGHVIMPEVRNNGAVTLDDDVLRSMIWLNLSDRWLPQIDGQTACGIHPRMRVYRYDPGQQFKVHHDGAAHLDGRVSKATFMIYLNTEYEGGETVFYHDHEERYGPGEVAKMIHPKTPGMGVLFDHTWWHESKPITSGTKYLFRCDVLFKPNES